MSIGKITLTTIMLYYSFFQIFRFTNIQRVINFTLQ